MKRLLYIILYVVLAASASAQVRVTGRVIDLQNKPVSDVIVKLVSGPTYSTIEHRYTPSVATYRAGEHRWRRSVPTYRVQGVRRTLLFHLVQWKLGGK